jgi:GxxExxY protein
MRIDELTSKVIGAAFTVHSTMGKGFLEKVYEQALAVELREQSIKVETQCPLPVYYRGINVGEYYADMLINDCLIVEIKAVEELSRAHEAQLVNYLTASGINDGLLINFGSSVKVRRKFRVYKKSSRN